MAVCPRFSEWIISFPEPNDNCFSPFVINQKQSGSLCKEVSFRGSEFILLQTGDLWQKLRQARALFQLVDNAVNFQFPVVARLGAIPQAREKDDDLVALNVRGVGLGSQRQRDQK